MKVNLLSIKHDRKTGEVLKTKVIGQQDMSENQYLEPMIKILKGAVNNEQV